MDGPPLCNETAATVQLVPQLDLDGGQVVLVLIKQRFQLDPSGRPEAAFGAQIRWVDEPWDTRAPETSSIRYPSDVCLRKPSTDVLVSGSAMAVGRAQHQSLDVRIQVGPVQLQLRVFGLRVWYKGLTGISPSDPRSFDEVPLKWELAYGGPDEPRNPVGRGVVNEPSALVSTPVPAIEDPRELIKSHRSRPSPVGVGPVGRTWMPRRSYLGTYDPEWRRERMPLLPKDFDVRHNQLAPPALVAPTPLVGGEPVVLENLCAEGPLRFTLPKKTFHVLARTREAALEHRASLDTVLFEPNIRRFEMTWRSTVPVPEGRKRCTAIHVAEGKSS